MYIVTIFTLKASNYRFWSLIIQTILMGMAGIIISLINIRKSSSSAKRRIKKYTTQQAQNFTRRNLKDCKIANQKIRNHKVIDKYKDVILIHIFNKSKEEAQSIQFESLSRTTKNEVIKKMNLSIFFKS